MKGRFCHIPLLVTVAAGLLIQACSTTRCLQEGQERLTSNKIHVQGNKQFDSGELTPYIKQKALGWSPMLCVYNWENGKGKGWDNFVHKIGTAPVVFDSTQISSSINNMNSHLEYLGYYNSDIKYSIDRKKRRKVSVNYDIVLGKRYPLKSVDYVLSVPESDFTDEFWKDTVQSLVRRGDFLSEDILEKESARSAESLRNKGYYDFNKNFFFFEADTLSYPDSAKLKIIVKDKTRNETEVENLSEGMTFRKYTFGRVKVSYPNDLIIKDKILKDLNNVKSGESYSEKMVNTLYSRYSSISLFNSVNVQVTPRDTSSIVDCTVYLSKSRLSGFKVGLEASINSNYLFGIAPELSFFHKNLFHGGEVLSVSITDNNQVKFGDNSVKSTEVGVSTSLTIPRFIPFGTALFKGPSLPKTEIKLSYNYQNRPEFTRNMFSGNFGYKGSFKKIFYYEVFPLSVNYVKMVRLDPEFAKTLISNPFLKNAYDDHLDAGLTTTMALTNTMSMNPTESFWYTKLQLNLSGNVLAAFGGLMRKNSEGRNLILNVPYSQYVRADLNLGRTWIWGKDANVALATHFRAGIGHAYGNAQSLPFEKFFYCGGANSMRGWTARTLGPGSMPLETSWVIPNQTGSMLLEANAEFRCKLFWKFGAAVFVDAGNVWELGEPYSEEARFNVKTIAMDWGYGLRVDLSFIVLRLDVGMRVHDPARPDPWLKPANWMNKGNYAIHFGVGYPF